MPGPLDGIRVFDLTRVLAGPTCTQTLGDLGADVIKIERPGMGDDTRSWGPPFLKDSDGNDTSESAYFLCANRNKRSITLDLGSEKGQEMAREFIAKSQVLVENFKTGGMEKYGLGYDAVKEINPSLVYCSITGFGHTGPYAERPGYDFLVQGLGGIMSITGTAEGEPLRVGVPISDLMTGMWSAVAICAALRHREATGEGQHLDMSLLDSTVATLANQGLNYLMSGVVPERIGNVHPNVVPYQVFRTADGDIVVAVGNDRQFQRFCDFAEMPELAASDDFKGNDGRVRNRARLTEILNELFASKPSAYWLEGLEKAGISCGPINRLDQVFADPQVQARGMEVPMSHAASEEGIRVIGSPIKMSDTKVDYRLPPPLLGQHTDEVLEEVLGLDAQVRDALRADGVI